MCIRDSSRRVVGSTHAIRPEVKDNTQVMQWEVGGRRRVM